MDESIPEGTWQGTYNGELMQVQTLGENVLSCALLITMLYSLSLRGNTVGLK